MSTNARMSLKLSKIHKTYTHIARPVEVLRGVSLELKGGEALAIMGPSGSGKSTLLHIIGTLDHPSSGSLEINGENPFALPEMQLARFRNRVVGFVFQDHHLLPQYSVFENTMLPAFAFSDIAGDPAKRAKELLARVGLADRMEHRPAELSGGESQRVAVARALMNSPSLLLCDEPTGNLDQANASGIAELLFDLHRQEQNILIVVTHSEQLASRFGRRSELADGVLRQVHNIQ
jgi:lipoprotein-releasing system ATP-binding protein